jgi:hypothetical protein
VVVGRAWGSSPVVALAPLLVLYLVVGGVAQPGPDPVRDEPALLAAAERLVEHGQLSGTGSDPDQRAFLWHGPGLVVLLAPLVALGVPLEVVRLTSPLLLFAAIVLLHGALPRRRALLFSYALGLYAPFVIVLGTVQKEPLAVLLVVAALRLFPRPSAGLALAALVMVRPGYGWVVLALAGICVAVHVRSRAHAPAVPLALLLTAVLGCVPWLAYTHARTGEPLYWSSSSGLSLFWMSPTGVPGETGQWHSPVRVFRDDRLTAHRPFFRRLDEVHPLTSDRALKREALENIRAEPLVYARNVAANAARLLVYAPATPRRATGELVAYAAGNGLLLLGLAWAAPRLRHRRPRDPRTVPFALFAALAVAVHLPPSASPRMLIPVVPVLVHLIAQAQATRPPGERRGHIERRFDRTSEATGAAKPGHVAAR